MQAISQTAKYPGVASVRLSARPFQQTCQKWHAQVPIQIMTALSMKPCWGDHKITSSTPDRASISTIYQRLTGVMDMCNPKWIRLLLPRVLDDRPGRRSIRIFLSRCDAVWATPTRLGMLGMIRKMLNCGCLNHLARRSYSPYIHGVNLLPVIRPPISAMHSFWKQKEIDN